MQAYDVIIIGMGPAGLVCARELQDSGMRVLLLEKNEAIGRKVCAGGLTTKITKAGLPLSLCDQLFSSVKLNYHHHFRTISSEEPVVGTINREKLGNYLLNAVDAKKIDIRKQSKVIALTNEYVQVGSDKYFYRYLVGADGSHSIVRRFMGLKTNVSMMTLQYNLPINSQELELFFDPPYFGIGGAWVFPHKDYSAVGCGCDMLYYRHQGATFRKKFEAWLKAKGFIVNDAPLQGGLINVDYQGFQFANKFLVGDAGGFASRLTGEGIAYAMISGVEVARKILDENYTCEKIQNILRNKNRQEKIYRSLMKAYTNRLLLPIYCHSLFFLSRFKWFSDRALRLCC